MEFDFDPYVRFAAKTAYLIKNKYIVARDCRLLYIISGCGKFETNGNTFDLLPRTLIYYPYDVPYRINGENDMLFYTINFDFSHNFTHIPTTVPKLVQDHDSNDILDSMNNGIKETFSHAIYIPDAFWAESDIDAIYNEALSQNDGFSQMQSIHIKRILINICRKKSEHENPLCIRIKSIVHDDLSAKIKDIAQEINYHPFYLNEVFKKHEGMTLHKYILRQRLIKGYELVTATQKSLEDIAQECSFSSHAHFSSAFHAMYGISPGKLRRQV